MTTIFDGINETLNIKDIKVANGTSGGFYTLIHKLDDNGVGLAGVWGWFEDEGLEGAWYNIDDESIIDETLTRGKAFYITTEDTSAHILSSGSVNVSPLTIPLAVGVNVLGNPLPVDVNIQDVKVSGATPGGFNTLIHQLDSNGVALPGAWGWFEDEGLEGAWYNIDDESLIEETLVSGKGLYFTTSDTSAKITFPSAL